MMNEKKSISIIMPCYNVAKYIGESLDSLLAQTYSDYEIICVDDGSTDETSDILKKYRAKDNRIRIVTQENQHAGVARNNGLAHAEGKYVLFLDPDDIFDQHMLKSLYGYAEKMDAEVVMYGYSTFDNESKEEKKVRYPRLRQKKLYNRRILGTRIFTVCYENPWTKFIRRSLIEKEDIQFQNIKSCNDVYFSRMVTITADRMFFLKKRFVHYRTNNIHSLQGNPSKDPYCLGKAIKGIYTGLSQRGLFDQDLKTAYFQYAHNDIVSILESNLSLAKYEELGREIRDDLLPAIYKGNEDYLCPLEKRILSCRNMEEFLYVMMRHFQYDHPLMHGFAYRTGSKIKSILLKVYQTVPFV